MSSEIDYELTGPVATITLNRPERLNALFGAMRADLLDSIERAAGESRVLVIRGAGRAFCAGGDVAFMAQLRRDQDSEKLASLVEQGKRVVSRLMSLSIPTVAAVHGVAAGAGLGLALACDFRVMSEGAKLTASFVKLGLSPDWGVSFFLTRMLGPARATELLLSARMIDAAEAHRIGLASELAAADDFDRRIGELSEHLGNAAPASIAYIKRLIRDAQHLTLGEMMDREQEAQLACFATADAREGLLAFVDKRAPRFEGK